MFSSCNISGFFCLTSGNRVLVKNRFRALADDSQKFNGTFFAYYDTVVTLKDDSFTSAVLRIPCSCADDVQKDGTLVHVIGSVFIDMDSKLSLIDATQIKIIPSDASSLFPPSAAFFNSHIECLGRVSGKAYALKDNSVVFPVAVTVSVHGEMRVFQLM
jgi:hypothetical protein